jgi:rhodanese-related sulfurtransferase
VKKGRVDTRLIKVPQSRLMPLDTVRKSLNELKKDSMFVTMCQACVRAYSSPAYILSAGYENTNFVDGSLAYGRMIASVLKTKINKIFTR